MFGNVLTVGDLFMENDDWVNDEEAQVFQRIEDLIRKFKEDNPLKRATTLYVNSSEETESYLMWFASTYNLTSKKTKGVTRVG